MVPPATNLARDAILQSMLDHVSEYAKKYLLVKIDILKGLVIKEVIDAPKNKSRFDPNVQLRGFLKTFEDTPAFKSQFEGRLEPSKMKRTMGRTGRKPSAMAFDSQILIQTWARSLPDSPTRHHCLSGSEMSSCGVSLILRDPSCDFSWRCK